MLQGGAAATTASALGLGGFLLATNPASATAGGSISDPDAVMTDDGTVKWVAVLSTGRLNWTGFDESVEGARIVVDVELVQSDTVFTGTIHDTGQFSFPDNPGDWGGGGDEAVSGTTGHLASDSDWGIIQENGEHWYNPEDEDTLADGSTVASAGEGYPLPSDPVPSSYLTAHTDGGQQKTRVYLSATYALYDGSGSELTGASGYPDRPSSSSDFVVTVQNKESDVSFGDADAEGHKNDGAKASGE